MEKTALTTINDPVKSLWQKLPKTLKACFFSAFGVGILCHLYMLTNKMINWDDLMTQPDVGGGPYFGRWLQFYLHQVFSKWGAPALNGVFAILFISIAACFIVALLNIQSVTLAVLTGVILVSFPAVTSAMFYMDLVPMFMLAFLFACMAAYFTRRFRFGGIAGAVLLVLSMAIYQAYFPCAVLLLVLASLQDVLRKEPVKKIFLNGVKEIVVLASGMILYLCSIPLSGYQLKDYKGMGSIGHNSLSSYVKAVLRVYHRLIQYFITDPDSFMAGNATVVSRIIAVLTVVLIIAVLVKKKFWKSPAYLLLYLLLLVLVPLAEGLVYVMSVEVSKATTVMIYGYTGFYLLPMVLLEALPMPQIQWKQLVVSGLSILTIVAIGAACFFQIRMANQAYYREYIADRRMQSFCTRILSSLEQQDGYEYGDPILIAGDVSISEGTNPIDARDLESDEFADLEGFPTEDGYLLPDNRSAYMELFLGVSADDYPEGFSREAIEETEEYQAMTIYPAEGSIREIDGVWVVRIAE